MRRSLVPLLTLCLATVATAKADEAKSGLKPGASVSEFEFVDLTGPNRGKQLSQVEAFGASAVVLALVNGSPRHSRDLIVSMQKLADTYKPERLKVFVAFTSGAEVVEPIVQFARENAITIPVGYAADTVQLKPYGLDPAYRNAVVVYRKRKVQAAFKDVDNKSLTDLMEATRQLLDER